MSPDRLYRGLDIRIASRTRKYLHSRIHRKCASVECTLNELVQHIVQPCVNPNQMATLKDGVKIHSIITPFKNEITDGG